MTATKTSTIRAVWPLLVVDDLDASIAFWTQRLGFSIVGRAEADGRVFWCRLERDGASIMLESGESEPAPASIRGKGVVFYFVCEDVDSYLAEVTRRGLDIEPPTNTYYGMRQIFVPEPNGYSICFESAIGPE